MDVWLSGELYIHEVVITIDHNAWRLSFLQIYEISVGKALFQSRPNPKFKLDEAESMLHQMICFTLEDFSAEQLTISEWAAQYFDETC